MKKLIPWIGMIVVTLGCLLMTGCGTTTGDVKIATLSEKTLNTTYIRGRTTMREVKQRLGNPDNIDIATNGNVKWIYFYTKSTYDRESYVPIVNIFHKGTNNYYTKVIFIFNKHHILTDYAMVHTYQKLNVGLVK